MAAWPNIFSQKKKDLILLPGALTYLDGAQVACGFGTVYEALEKIGVSGNDAVLITGLGPVGLAAGARAANWEPTRSSVSIFPQSGAI